MTEVDTDIEQLREPILDSKWPYTSVCCLELSGSPGGEVLSLLVSQAACNLGLCLSGPIA